VRYGKQEILSVFVTLMNVEVISSIKLMLILLLGRVIVIVATIAIGIFC